MALQEKKKVSAAPCEFYKCGGEDEGEGDENMKMEFRRKFLTSVTAAFDGHSYLTVGYLTGVFPLDEVRPPEPPGPHSCGLFPVDS